MYICMNSNLDFISSLKNQRISREPLKNPLQIKKNKKKIVDLKWNNFKVLELRTIVFTIKAGFADNSF